MIGVGCIGFGVGIGCDPVRGAPAPPAPLSTFFGDDVPVNETANDTGAVTVGTVLGLTTPITLRKIRFWKTLSDPSATHTVAVWQGGVLLGSQDSAGETAHGWQEVALGSPITIDPGGDVIVGCFFPNGQYAVTPHYFAADVDRGALYSHITKNGRYAYGASLTLPTDDYNETAYFVDVVYDAT